MDKPLSKKTIAIIVGQIVILFLAALPAYYYYTKYQDTQVQLKKIATQQPADEAKALVQKVGRHYDIPNDEDPTIATISDIEKLRDQAFFAKAKNGDKILVFAKWKRAVLYDPVQDKVLEVGPVNFPQPTETITTTPTSVSPTVLPTVTQNPSPTKTPKE